LKGDLMKNKRIFITGGAGFIGSNLVDKLVNENEIVIYDNLSSGHKEWILDKKAKFIHGDILDFENLKNSMKDIDVVIHLAANPDVRLGEKNIGRRPEAAALKPSPPRLRRLRRKSEAGRSPPASARAPSGRGLRRVALGIT
jgi:uncharacterized protein YbjT (DUF2867 family)